jgi:hypothetical protein
MAETITIEEVVAGRLKFQTDNPQSYIAGQLSYDPITKTLLADTGFTGVRVNVGQETHIRFKNDTGGTITNGTVVNAGDVDTANDVIRGIVMDITNPAFSSAILGIATADVLDGEIGIATRLGEVRDLDTSTLTEGGVLYAAVGGGLTNTFQNYPNRVVIIGTVIKKSIGAADDGIVYVDASIFNRNTDSRSYSFTSSGVGIGTHYFAGFYDNPTADTTLTQGSLTQAYGIATNAYEAHAFAVFAGDGVVDTGVVGLRVNGTSMDDDGVQVPGDSQILTEDITVPLLSTYIETPKKWLGAVTYELYVVSGVPTVYSVSFNYGYAKYEDISNNDFTVTDFEVVGLAAANDVSFELELLHHTMTGWDYAATGFVAGNGAIAKRSTDQVGFSALSNGNPFAWKRDDLSQFINGDTTDGILVRVTQGSNNSVQTLNAHMGIVVEELVF